MNLSKDQRIKVYNSQILAFNSQRELDEVIESISSEDDRKILINMSLRLQGIIVMLKDIIKASRDED